MECRKVIVDVCLRKHWQYDGRQATVTLEGGRRQIITFEEFLLDGEDMLRFFTVVGPVDILSPIQLDAVLRLNYSHAYGAMAICGYDLIMVDTLLLKHDCHEQLAYAIQFMAETADRYEREIYRTDHH
jgi:hypothetical protein